jgi:hypothetical protein
LGAVVLLSETGDEHAYIMPNLARKRHEGRLSAAILAIYSTGYLTCVEDDAGKTGKEKKNGRKRIYQNNDMIPL